MVGEGLSRGTLAWPRFNDRNDTWGWAQAAYNEVGNPGRLFVVCVNGEAEQGSDRLTCAQTKLKLGAERIEAPRYGIQNVEVSVWSTPSAKQNVAHVFSVPIEVIYEPTFRKI